MIGRLSSFSGPSSILFKKKRSNLILDLKSHIGLSGIIWEDQSNYNNDATLYGTIATASLDNGIVVLSLDGVNDYIIPISGFGNLLDNGFTYEVWAYPETLSNGTLISEWSGNPPTGWNDSQMAFVSGDINSSVFIGADSPSNYINGPSFSVNTWYNIVMTYNSNILSLYINGQISSTMSLVKSNPPSTYLSLGRSDTANSYLGGSTGYFKGYIGTWRIWDGPLTSSQITSNYNSLKSIYIPFQPIQLLLNSSFDSGVSNWTSNRGFGVYSYTSSSQPAVLSSILYFSYVNTVVSQSVNVFNIISDVETFTAVINLKHREKSDAVTYTQIDQYSFEVLFKNSSGSTIISKRTPTSGQQNAPQYFTDISLILNRSDIPNFDTIYSIQVNISGIDIGYWGGNHGPMIEYVTLVAS
jgi:hypothetical protein